MWSVSYLLPYVTSGRSPELRPLTASRHGLTGHSASRGLSQASWVPCSTTHRAELAASWEWQPWPPAWLHLNKAMGIPEGSWSSQKHLGSKKTPSRSSSSTISLTYRFQSLNQVPRCHIHMSPQYFQAGRLSYFCEHLLQSSAFSCLETKWMEPIGILTFQIYARYIEKYMH